MTANAAIPDVEAHRYGFDVSISASEARNCAIKHGILVMGIHGSVWPGTDDEFHSLASRQMLEELVIFCVYARRCIEILDVRDLKVEGSLWSFRPNVTKYPYEKRMWQALNKILHARHLQTLVFDMTTQRFENLGDRIICCVEAKSDVGDLAYVCPTALVTSFLSRRTQTSFVGE